MILQPFYMESMSKEGRTYMKKFGKKIFLGMAIATFGFVFVGCGKKEEKLFTIAYAPNESTEQSADARNGLSEELTKLLDMKVKEIQVSDYNAIIEALRTGKADMAYMGAQAIALGNERAGIEPIVMKAIDGDRDKAVYHSLFITRSDNEQIQSIQDLKGKTIAFVDPDSTSGNLIPSSEIVKAFPKEDLSIEDLHTNGKFFEAASFSGKHQAGLKAVINNDVDVVPISDQILQSEIDNGNAKEEEIKLIHSSEAIPAEAMAVRKDLDQEVKNKVKDFLLSYDNGAYFEQVIKQPTARFIECSIEEYKPIMELNKLLNEE